MRNYWPDVFYRIMTNPVAIAALILFLALIASCGEYMVNDEGIWNYIGFLWVKHGIPPYSASVENKTPGIFFIYTLSNLLFGVNLWFPRILGSLSMVATSILLYLIGRKLLNDLAGILAMILFGLSATWKFVDGTYTAQVESFMILFSSLSFFFVLASNNVKNKSPNLAYIFIAGLSMGIAICFKQTALFSLLALLAFSYSLQSNYRNPLQVWSALLAGLIVPIFLSLLALFASGANIMDYLNEAWLILLESGGGAADFKISRRIWNLVLIWRYSEMVLFYPLVLLFIILRQRIRDYKIPFWGIILWITFDFIGVNASGFYFGHQFKQVLPALSLASGIAISALIQTAQVVEKEKRRYAFLLLLIVAIMWAPYKTLVRSYKMTIKGVTTDEYGKYRELGLWIKENSEDSDYVYILGEHSNPALAYSERRSASRYFNTIFINRSGAREEIMEDLTQKKPKFVLIEKRVSKEITRRLPELEILLKQWYRHKITQYDNVDIYERKS